jgi:hypothetical protein
MNMSSNIVFGSVVNMQLAATPSAGSYLVAYDGSTGHLSQKNDQGVVSRIGVAPTVSGVLETFPSDIQVSLSPGKSFGKYINGMVVPANGKTGVEVIIDALAEPIIPTLSLTSLTTIKYNQSSISNVLNFSYVINSLGAIASSTLLEWSRNNSGSWATLSTDKNISTFTHTLNDTIGFNTQPFNYRYTVIDSQGAINSVTKDITPESYVAPDIVLSVIAATKSGPETDLKREKGNIASNLTGTINRMSEFVQLISYQLQYKKNGSGSWLPIGGVVTINNTNIIVINFTIPITNHLDSLILSDANSIVYSVIVTDTHTTNQSVPVTVNLLNIIFYGPASIIPSSSNEVRALPYKSFTDVSNPFILNTGNLYYNFVVAMPSTLSILNAIDLDANYAPIYYTSTPLNIFDFISTSVPYKIYSSTQAIPYSENHRHQITR